MKWLLSMLGFPSQKPKTVKPDTEEFSFLRTKLISGALRCHWQIRQETTAMIDRDFGSRLFIRIRDISGDHSSSSKTIEVLSSQTETTIELPASTGRILIDLGYRYGDDFITLEYQVLNFGQKVIEMARYTDWFTKESPNIHQEMYELASAGRSLGGSEMGQKQSEL